MKNFFKYTLTLLLLCSVVSAATKESLLFEYCDGLSPKVSLETSDKTILDQVSALLDGTPEEKYLALSSICKGHIARVSTETEDRSYDYRKPVI